MPISSYLGSSALLPAGTGFRNVIINGGFDIWQRGTSATALSNVSSSAFLADRWQGTRSGGGAKQSQISAGLDGFRYAIRIQRDSGNTSTTGIVLSQSFEGDVAIKFANKPIVLSFYARAGSNYSPTNSLLSVKLGVGTGAEANVVYTGYTGYSEPINTTVALTTTWQRFYLSCVVPSNTTQAGLMFTMNPIGTASTNDYFDITGVQLEQNYQATPFEQRPLGVELSLCQRYYEKGNHYYTGYDAVYGGENHHFPVYYKVEKRTSSYSVSFTGVTFGAAWSTSKSLIRYQEQTYNMHPYTSIDNSNQHFATFTWITDAEL